MHPSHTEHRRPIIPRPPPFALACALVWILAFCAQATAQTHYSSNRFPCSDGSEVVPNSELGEKAIGICNLGGSHTLPAQGGGSIPFAIRSCWAWWGGNPYALAECVEARDYTIELNGPTDGTGAFVLSGPGGDIPVQIAFSANSGTPYSLAPAQQSPKMPGAANGALIPVTLEITLPQSSTLPAGEYSGQFDFYLYQCEGNWQGSDCRAVSSNARAELSPPVPFRIRLVIEPKIRISGLNDMVITANPTGTTEADQTFCVYSEGGLPFQITADSGNGNGTFVLAGNVDQIEYQAAVGSLAQGIQHPLTEAEPSAQSWPGEPSENCSASSENMRIGIRIPPEEIGGVTETSYTDTLTLTVTLE